MMFSINLLEFAAEAGVKAAGDKEHHHNADVDQIIHNVIRQLPWSSLDRPAALECRQLSAAFGSSRGN
jgi:hypothetical protein